MLLDALESPTNLCEVSCATMLEGILIVGGDGGSGTLARQPRVELLVLNVEHTILRFVVGRYEVL